MPPEVPPELDVDGGEPAVGRLARPPTLPAPLGVPTPRETPPDGGVSISASTIGSFEAVRVELPEVVFPRELTRERQCLQQGRQAQAKEAAELQGRLGRLKAAEAGLARAT